MTHADHIAAHLEKVHGVKVKVKTPSCVGCGGSTRVVNLGTYPQSRPPSPVPRHQIGLGDIIHIIAWPFDNVLVFLKLRKPGCQRCKKWRRNLNRWGIHFPARSA